VAPKLFFQNFEPLFLEKYPYLYKASLAKSLPFVGFYHRLKYLHNLQSHFIQSDPEISLEKKTVIGDDETKSLTKKFSYKSFFVFEIQMIENLVKIASMLLS
jgi:hypothetical protein